MKIALIGYGAMGKLIERVAAGRGHEIGVIIDDEDANSFPGEVAAKLKGCDAAIDFTVAMAVRRNVEACVMARVPVVLGTTGWNEQRGEIEHVVSAGNGSLVFGANFSIGVNLFYKIAEYASEVFAKFPEYEAFIEEQHHSRKLDSPSGTALKIKSIVEKHLNKDIAVAATRAGNIPGTHRVGFDGAADQILLEHTARSREGFASGAVLAAEWIAGKTGFYEFTDVLDEIIQTG
ncbi:MAG: hypothetical protein KA956_05690 [Pyrinomonadaceae bacterium]|nr:4-hydroxy-tetrahydrodipicolinate reductase [Acidobacteriota bacterium]MBK7933853.1 4-hydroxy-tetrahydrodipicolinate reductase [Acidobacteriota bacterium]MBP7375949.1 hypothetical protein [Pyrinomonadaceae bacterium]